MEDFGTAASYNFLPGETHAGKVSRGRSRGRFCRVGGARARLGGVLDTAWQGEAGKERTGCGEWWVRPVQFNGQG